MNFFFVFRDWMCLIDAIIDFKASEFSHLSFLSFFQWGLPALDFSLASDPNLTERIVLAVCCTSNDTHPIWCACVNQIWIGWSFQSHDSHVQNWVTRVSARRAELSWNGSCHGYKREHIMTAYHSDFLLQFLDMTHSHAPHMHITHNTPHQRFLYLQMRIQRGGGMCAENCYLDCSFT